MLIKAQKFYHKLILNFDSGDQIDETLMILQAYYELDSVYLTKIFNDNLPSFNSEQVLMFYLRGLFHRNEKYYFLMQLSKTKC